MPGRQQPPNPRAGTQPAKDLDWRKFPELERLFQSGDMPAMLERIERTCRLLDNLAQSGSGADGERAQAALAAYGRTLELIRELQAEQQKMAEDA